VTSASVSALDFAAGLARQAGALLVEYFRRGQFNPTLKPDHSVVTEADVAADRLIAGAIQAQFPNDLLLSEELAPSYDPQGLAQQAVWIVDPLDGTTNFAVGLQHWGVLIARLVNGMPDTGVLYFPLLDELYTAQRGRGAALNGLPLRTPAPGDLSPVSFFSCCTRTARRYNVSVPYKMRILGSTGYTLAAIARGLAIVGFESTPKVWDLAAGWVLIEEAGGVIESYTEPAPFPLRPGLDYVRQSFPTLAAASPALAAQTRQQITPKT
jgi:myo-inositol-1(or 4)-monophosphatase